MASDCFKVKTREKSEWQRNPDNELKRRLETTMKFSSKLESPPPKPPRRRYSDQLSVSSLGTYSTSKKHNEDSRRIDPKFKTPSPQPAFQSLPTNLTSNLLIECTNSPTSLSHSFDLSEQLKHSRENHLYGKSFSDNLKLADYKHNYVSNRINHSEKFLIASQGMTDDHVFTKIQYSNSVPHSTDKIMKNSSSFNKVCMSNKCQKQDWNALPKDCHRRHNSDPIISQFNLQNDNIAVKFDQERCCNSICFFTKKLSKSFESEDSCTCCKKSYFIMQEIRILKEINDKLWQHLCSLQSYVENIRKKTFDEFADVSVSGLLSSVYYAQKAKDSAMEERVKVALEERDAILLELEDLIQFLTKSFNPSGGEKEVEKDIKELLSEMACTSNLSKLLKHQRMLLAHIHNLKESKQDCLSNELKQAIIERDSALEKVKKLEEEVKDLKLSYDLWHSDNKHWEYTILDILNQLMHQRDSILSKTDNGLDISSIMYRSPITGKLESMDHQNVSPFDSCSKTIESIKNCQSIHVNDYKQRHSFGASDEVIQLKEEILLLNKTLENEIKKREQAEGKCIRLERLIHILRKKLNGQNIGVPV